MHSIEKRVCQKVGSTQNASPRCLNHQHTRDEKGWSTNSPSWFKVFFFEPCPRPPFFRFYQTYFRRLLGMIYASSPVEEGEIPKITIAQKT